MRLRHSTPVRHRKNFDFVRPHPYPLYENGLRFWSTRSDEALEYQLDFEKIDLVGNHPTLCTKMDFGSGAPVELGNFFALFGARPPPPSQKWKFGSGAQVGLGEIFRQN